MQAIRFLLEVPGDTLARIEGVPALLHQGMGFRRERISFRVRDVEWDGDAHRWDIWVEPTPEYQGRSTEDFKSAGWTSIREPPF